jgi:hypothetical protein
MTPYANRSGKSGVTAYRTGPDFIIVEFMQDGVYLYNYTRPGRRHVNKMKALAERGEGLSTYISRHVREDFFKKLE